MLLSVNLNTSSVVFGPFTDLITSFEVIGPVISAGDNLSREVMRLIVDVLAFANIAVLHISQDSMYLAIDILVGSSSKHGLWILRVGSIAVDHFSDQTQPAHP